MWGSCCGIGVKRVFVPRQAAVCRRLWDGRSTYHEMALGGCQTAVYWIGMRRALLRSAVGKTRDLRSDLWWTIPLHILIDRFGIPFGFHTIKSALVRHFHILPTGLHGLCFGFCFAGPLPLRFLLHGPLSRVHFGESLVVRLYSEIDHIHLTSEAQCVSHLYPRWTATWQLCKICNNL